MSQPQMQAATGVAVQEKRKEKRLNIAVRVRLGSNEALTDGELAVTYEISLSGVRISGLPKLKVGATVWMQRLTKRARYKVIWVGEPGTAQTQQAGLACVDLDKPLWEEEIRQKLAG